MDLHSAQWIQWQRHQWQPHQSIMSICPQKLELGDLTMLFQLINVIVPKLIECFLKKLLAYIFDKQTNI